MFLKIAKLSPTQRAGCEASNFDGEKKSDDIFLPVLDQPQQ